MGTDAESMKLSKIYYSSGGYWKGGPAITELVKEAGIDESVARKTGVVANLFTRAEARSEASLGGSETQRDTSG